MFDESKWFDEWVRVHCIATGATEATAECFRANRGNFVDFWKATTQELGECTARVARSGAIPNWPREHVDAVGRELNTIRTEKAYPIAEEMRDAQSRRACAFCDGTGLAEIPHTSCLMRDRSGQWAVALHRSIGRAVSMAVPCDKLGCVAGDAVRASDADYRNGKARFRNTRNTALGDYERHYGCDLVALWRDHRRQESRRAAADGGADGELSRLCARILAKVRRG